MMLLHFRTLAAFSFYGLTEVQVTLLLSGVALIFAIRRWRFNVMRKRQQLAASSVGKSTANSAKTERPAMSSALNVREVTTQVQSLLAEVEDTARRVAAQIDNRRVRLEQLMAEADEKIRRLEELTKATAEAPRPPAQTPTTTTSTPPNVAVLRDAAQTLSRLRQERGAPAATEDPAYRPIYDLADQGKTAREIGQALGRQPGEIELILALRGRQRV